MSAWVLRAVGLGALVVVLRVLLGLLMGSLPTYGTLWRAVCLGVIVAVAVTWGVRDARSASGTDLTVRWLAAGIAAGLGSGAVCLVLDNVPGIELGDAGALFELTSAAAFIMLLIFLPALAGVGYGHARSGRSAKARAATVSEPELAPAR
ncbi:B-4DMT family transporter [Nocardia mangyaensis]|uniref:B-4DMT family transporter n=1 Tax=Nocardia mangyaensis TaxID=2213200 RepID=UPI002676037D|nr:B-4DMT family transporter [Nocardia mangyaensis]MDO3646707.1 B-4DMT family transporter [Nocardia mangyaensis]